MLARASSPPGGAAGTRTATPLGVAWAFNASRGFWFTLDAQHIANPAHNADRGPVDILGCRIHVEY